MTNRLALIIIIVIIALLALDYYQYGWGYSVFLLRKLTDLIEWMAFWR